MKIPSPEWAEARRRFHFAVAHITFAWAEIENNLAMLLSAIILEPHDRLTEAPSDKERLGATILFTPSSLDARIDIVYNAFVVVSPWMPQAEIVQDLWNRLYKRLRKQKGTRNTVAHGSMITLMRTNRSGELRLTAPALDPRFIGKDGGPKGMTTHELEQAGHAMRDISDRLKDFTHLVQHWRRGNAQAYEETLLRLQGLVPTTDSAPESPTPPKP